MGVCACLFKSKVLCVVSGERRQPSSTSPRIYQLSEQRSVKCGYLSFVFCSKRSYFGVLENLVKLSRVSHYC